MTEAVLAGRFGRRESRERNGLCEVGWPQNFNTDLPVNQYYYRQYIICIIIAKIFKKSEEVHLRCTHFKNVAKGGSELLFHPVFRISVVISMDLFREELRYSTP